MVLAKQTFRVTDPKVYLASNQKGFLYEFFKSRTLWDYLLTCLFIFDKIQDSSISLNQTYYKSVKIGNVFWLAENYHNYSVFLMNNFVFSTRRGLEYVRQVYIVKDWATLLKQFSRFLWQGKNKCFDEEVRHPPLSFNNISLSPKVFYVKQIASVRRQMLQSCQRHLVARKINSNGVVARHHSLSATEGQIQKWITEWNTVKVCRQNARALHCLALRIWT